MGSGSSIWEHFSGRGLEEAQKLIMQHLKKVKPAIVVVDSFKIFDDLAKSQEEHRKFGYEIAVNFMAWETTALLLGEYSPENYETNPLFSIVDGLITLTQREAEASEPTIFFGSSRCEEPNTAGTSTHLSLHRRHRSIRSASNHPTETWRGATG